MNARSSQSEPSCPTAEELFPDLAATGEQMNALLGHLIPFTDEPGRLTRLYLSPSHRKAADAVTEMMSKAGMTARMDAAGSVFGRYAGLRPDAPTLLIGSHIDSVVDGGHYDGPLGVMCGIAVVEALNRAGVRLPFAVEVCAFGDEENVRFPTHLSTSSALAGAYEAEWLDRRDEAGTTLRDALMAFGGDPAGIAALERRPEDLVGYLEVHIEQGPILEQEDLPVGVVTAITGITKAEGVFVGEAGHAGTVPMAQRTDALVALGEAAVLVSSIAGRHPNAVATIGRALVSPGASNVIPGRVEFSLDARAPDNVVRRALFAEIEAGLREIAERRKVRLSLDITAQAQATPMDPRFTRALTNAVEAEGYRVQCLPSGAGHDAIALAKITRTGMLFVRCEKGISHSPRESITAADAAVAARVLFRAVRGLALGGSSDNQ